MQEEKKVPAGYVATKNNTLTPVSMVKDYDFLKDDVVKNLFKLQGDINGILATFKKESMEELDCLFRCLEEEYGLKNSSEKGNRTVESLDGNFRITISVQDFLELDEHLLVAKELLDEYALELVEDSNSEIKQIILNSFQVDKSGRFSMSRILPMLKWNIDNDKWQKAMGIIRQGISVTSSKRYIRFYERDKVTNGWVNIPLDIAKV